MIKGFPLMPPIPTATDRQAPTEGSLVRVKGRGGGGGHRTGNTKTSDSSSLTTQGSLRFRTCPLERMSLQGNKK